MKLNLLNSHILIGAKSTTEHAINLPHLPADESIITVNNTQYASYFCSLPEQFSNTNKVSRCIYLIKQLLLQVEHEGGEEPVDTPIFLLLPEFIEPFTHEPEVNDEEIHNHQTLAYFARELKTALPFLFSHPQSQIFPFGRASFPIALAAAKTLFEEIKKDDKLQQEANQTVTFISVDTLWYDIPKIIADNALVSSESDQGIIPSEGAILCQIQPANEGINIEFIQNSVAPSKQLNSTIELLFNESVTHLQNKKDEQTKAGMFTHLYLPGNGNEKLHNSWLDAYFQLSQCIDERTSICQTGLFTGELGCLTGLYNFLHIINGYKLEYLQGNVLQLEVSDTLHQGVVLYSWDEA
ncbi:hypothetical protein ACOYR1_09905 [Thalassotalea piscium]